MLQYLGLWFKMAQFPGLSRREDYWKPEKSPYAFAKIMSWKRFKRITWALALPQYPGRPNDPFGEIRRWLDACQENWRLAAHAGTVLVVDETMVPWTGLGEMHLTYMPRKPAPLGIQLKVVCDGKTRLLLGMELVEGQTADKEKEHVHTHGPATATTMRLVTPWQGSGRIVVGDSWFGSRRTAESLMEMGLYSILCIKNGSRGYPKERLKELLVNRGDKAFMKVTVSFPSGQVCSVWAGGHMDKAPLLLCATTGTGLLGEPRVRHRSGIKAGKIERRRYVLEQPDMHATYREYSGVVDQFNRFSMGPGGLLDVWRTKKVWARMFAASLSFCETNAYLAYLHQTGLKTTRADWLGMVSDALLHSGEEAPPVRGGQGEDVQEAASALGAASGLSRVEVDPDHMARLLRLHGHCRQRASGQTRCSVCKTGRTYVTCACGKGVCNPAKKAVAGMMQRAEPQRQTCYAQHLISMLQGIAAGEDMDPGPDDDDTYLDELIEEI